jgi:hypothetical protein
LLGGPSALLVDPLGFDAGDSNLYRYVNNGPISKADPSGLDFIAVGRRDVKGTGGMFTHLSIAFFKSSRKARDRFYKSAFQQKDSTFSRIQGLELLASSGWRAKCAWEESYSFLGRFHYKVIEGEENVVVSVIRYDEEAAFYMTVFDSKSAKGRWDTILQLAKQYKYAEQADGNGYPVQFSGKFKNWPRSEYCLPPGNNSNTFIRWILREAGLPGVNWGEGFNAPGADPPREPSSKYVWIGEPFKPKGR